MNVKILLTGFITIFLLTNLNVIAIHEVRISNDNSYGYIINVEKTQEYPIINQIIQFVNKLLHEQITVYCINSDINSVLSRKLSSQSDPVDNNFLKGSYIIPYTKNTTFNKNINNLIGQQSSLFNEIYELMGPLINIEVFELVEPKIAYHAGDAVDMSNYKYVSETCCNFTEGKELSWEDIPNMLNNDDFNLFIWPGGTGEIDKLWADQTSHNSSFENITNFVKNGGGYIGSCYGGYEASNGAIVPDEIPNELDPFKIYFPDTSGWPFLSILDCWTFIALPGHGDIEVDIIDTESPVAFGLKNILVTLYYGGPMFFDIKENTKTLATIKSITSKWSWGFPQTGDRIDWSELPLNLWKDYAIGKTIWITSECGSGKVVAFGDHPEFGREKATRIISNAIFYTTSKGPNIVDIENSFYPIVQAFIDGPAEAEAFQQITFYGNATGGVQPYEWNWDFDSSDGIQVESIEQNPSHEYKNKDDHTYTVTLTVIDQNGQKGADIFEINVEKTRPRIYVFSQIITHIGKFNLISTLINLVSKIKQ